MWTIPKDRLVSGENPVPLIKFGTLEWLIVGFLDWFTVPKSVDGFLSNLIGVTWRGYIPCFIVIRFTYTGEYMIWYSWLGNGRIVWDRRSLRVI